MLWPYHSILLTLPLPSLRSLLRPEPDWPSSSLLRTFWPYRERQLLCQEPQHLPYNPVGSKHKQIIYDLKELALSCGISATGVDEEDLNFNQAGFTSQDPVR